MCDIIFCVQKEMRITLWLSSNVKPCLISVGAPIKTGFFYAYTIFMPPPFC